MAAYKANWFSVLKEIHSFIDTFVVGNQTFKINKLNESNFTIENITDPQTPIIVYELTRGKVVTYNITGNWESCLLQFGKATSFDVVNDNQQYWKYTIGVIPSIEESDY